MTKPDREDDHSSESTVSGAVMADTPLSDSERVAIGLAFGNSNSSIAWTNAEGKNEVIANEEGDRQIPSVLSYINGEEYGGAQAKAQLVRNPKNTVAFFRDFVGKRFKEIDPTNCHSAAHPEEQGGEVGFRIVDKPDSEEKSFVPVNVILTRHLRRLIKSATEYIGQHVTSAVITVPTNFTKSQEDALRHACSPIPLEILQIIREPTAALLAYDARNLAAHQDKIVLIADIGGTRSDISVIASRGGMYTTLATAHDYTLGGKALDQVLIDHFSTQFIRKYTDLPDPRTDARALAKLTLECESTRKTLSQSTTAPCSIESLIASKDFSSNIQRSRFEVLAGSTFARVTALITEAIRKAELDILDIDEVILSGGTSHTPKIARMLGTIFPEAVPIRAPSTDTSAINPSELCARGAAIQAYLIESFEAEEIAEKSSAVVTVAQHIQHPIGIMVMGRNLPGSAKSEKKTDREDGGEQSEPPKPAAASINEVSDLKKDDSTTREIKQAVFRPILHAETAAPSRRSVRIPALPGGGDVLVRICEGESYIQITHKTKPDKAVKKEPESDDEDDDDDGSQDEDELTIRDRMVKAREVLAECELKGISKGAVIEITLSLEKDGCIAFSCREIGGNASARGKISALMS